MIKTFADALALNGLTEKDFEIPGLESHEIAYRKLVLIAKTINEGWIPDFENVDQRKYVPYFYKENGAFVFSRYNFWYGTTNVGSRLCYKNFEITKYVATQFIDIYNEFLG